MHVPVLLREFLEQYSSLKIRTFIDCTLGGGGHSLALLENHPEIEKLYGIDQDVDALAFAREKLQAFEGKVEFIQGDFRTIKDLVPPGEYDGIFLDLGLSQMQLDTSDRGFSFMRDGPLDMRKDQKNSLTAEIIVNTYSEKELANLIFEYGEEHRSRRVASAIIEARKKRRIKTTFDLMEILKPVLTWGGRRNRHIHPMTLTFQALRIAVNDELEGLKEVIPESIDLLANQGRLGIISFHSLEDRIVKHMFREFEKNERVNILTKKPIVPSDEENASNPPSRSAKMRFIEST